MSSNTEEKDKSTVEAIDHGVGVGPVLFGGSATTQTRGDGSIESRKVPSNNERDVATSFDNPVKPPARNDSKLKRADAPRTSTAATLPSAAGDDSTSIHDRLFDPDRKQKPALWTHIKLVAPGPADQPPPGHLKWKSKHAVAAYCLKCKKQFTYTVGTSKTISRHMMNYHGMISTSGEMADDHGTLAVRGGRGGGLAATSAEPPLKKRKPELSNGKAASPTLLILKWLIGSFRPFSIVDDPGLKEFLRIYSSPHIPSGAELSRMAVDQASRIKQELKSRIMRLLPSFDGYSLGCEQFGLVNGRSYHKVKVSFCTNAFERMSFTLAVKDGSKSSCGSAVKETLAEYGLPIDKITTVTLRNILESEDLGLEGFTNSEYIYDVLFRMDVLVMEALNKGFVGSLLAQIRMHVAGTYETISDVYHVLQKCQSTHVNNESSNGNDNWKPTSNEQYMMKALSAILKPSFDATITLSDDKFPTVGLAVPVFRRIHNVWRTIDLNALSIGMIDSSVVASMQEFLRSLDSNFLSSFAVILGTGQQHPLMWTIPLDPRLIHMTGLSDDEKESVTNALVEHVKKQKLDQGSFDVTINETATEVDSEKKQEESSTMGGIFWGDNEHGTGSSIDAATYAKATVERYFITVRAQRRIEDPLDWWKSNQAHFPELGHLAQLWFGGSSTITGMSSQKDNFSGGNFSLVAFLHENIDLVFAVPFSSEEQLAVSA